MNATIEQEKDDGTLETVYQHEVTREFSNAACRVMVRQQHEGSRLYDVYCLYADGGLPKRIPLAIGIGLASGLVHARHWLLAVRRVSDYGKPIFTRSRAA